MTNLPTTTKIKIMWANGINPIKDLSTTKEYVDYDKYMQINYTGPVSIQRMGVNVSRFTITFPIDVKIQLWKDRISVLKTGHPMSFFEKEMLECFTIEEINL